MESPYTVLFFGSHPDEENDDCWYGMDFASEAEAELAFSADVENIKHCPARDVAYIMLDTEKVNKIRANPSFRPERKSDSCNEHAMQAGMMGGCEAYNDAMGW
jgi:hypothetical protein